ncbi:MAG: enoyl-CoA hydratase/isomerase family protein [Candidatus Micrarchaeales archaeon]|jgi:enoyl-CoA hydratase|nr:enoyl-CoA hydratase/isomerase family protein [Candidatus Micrarchaeales archaeon]
MADESVVVEHGTTTSITLNRPDIHNAINFDVLTGLRDAFASLLKDNSCRSIVLKGAGKSFCSGSDIKYLAAFKNSGEAAEFFDMMYIVYHYVESIDKPVIAEIHGSCMGAGLELAAVCDLRIASSDATFAMPEVKLGITPSGGATYRLPTVIGQTATRYMVLTGETIGADEAYRIGLLNKVVEPAKLDEEVRKVAEAINASSRTAVGNAKLAMTENQKFERRMEREKYIQSFIDTDGKEGLDAFINHRKPEFKS